MKLLISKIRAWREILRCFRNPILVSCLRLGWVKLPYFIYRIRRGGFSGAMLARPVATDHSDLYVLRTVLAEEEYADVLKLLPPSRSCGT